MDKQPFTLQLTYPDMPETYSVTIWEVDIAALFKRIRHHLWVWEYPFVRYAVQGNGIDEHGLVFPTDILDPDES